VLYRPNILEGSRVQVDGRAAAEVASGPRGKGLLWTSYGFWAVGAVALAGSLVTGALMRQEVAPLRACTTVSEPCTGYAEASSRLRSAEQYERAANGLGIAGAALSATGAVLFTWDLFSGGDE
jgi:hypothetical protein